jgi:hypothetical protein
MVTQAESRGARAIKSIPDDPERPEWPPRHGTKVALYLPDTANPDHQYLVEVEDLEGMVLTVTAPAGIESEFERTKPRVKLLFPGRRWGWGYDADLAAYERAPSHLWRLKLSRGPVPVERRDSERVPHKKIVMLRIESMAVPAHMLDRSAFGMRCVTGRGANIDVGNRVTVEIDAKNGDIVTGALVVWRRLQINGLEFGLSIE